MLKKIKSLSRRNAQQDEKYSSSVGSKLNFDPGPYPCESKLSGPKPIFVKLIF